MKTTTPQKPKQKTTSCSTSSSLKRRSNRPPTINLEEPRFVFLPFFKSRLRAIIDGGSTWYHYEDVMNLPDLEEAACSMHQRQRLVRRVIAKWTPFTGRVRRYTVLSESDFYRLLYATKHIDGGALFGLEEGPIPTRLAIPGCDFDTQELGFYSFELSDKQADWRKDKTGGPPMDDWNESD
ncbi:MAG: hypothetical protein IAE77_24170 [Prosthecobacter sp.]|uniref:hypothetical protein n=1 Tax=Prosthecobacter sp. TaxID=1965333 RepID=UPI0019EC81EF|nr:hypothetical protein [Prosthecobacter sp.]MBE2286576.1 hypothetical protein [Prosthecobacter sp.]